MEEFKIFAETYNPLEAGSIDKTDKIPHDNAICRALNSRYRPPNIDSNPKRIVFVGRLPWSADEDQIRRKFSKCGKIKNVNLIRDIITGFSRGYAFVEFEKSSDAKLAVKELKELEFAGKPVIVDEEVGRRMEGWRPRRLGGGWGGRKESGQLRFGCRYKPWKKPIVEDNFKMKPQSTNDLRSNFSRNSETSRKSYDSSNDGYHRRDRTHNSRDYDRKHDRRDRTYNDVDYNRKHNKRDRTNNDGDYDKKDRKHNKRDRTFNDGDYDKRDRAYNDGDYDRKHRENHQYKYNDNDDKVQVKKHKYHN